MPFHQRDWIRFYQFETLNHAGLVHAVFTRRGGISPAPWATLNFGGSVGDDRNRVLSNKALAFKALGLDPSDTYEVWQTHSAAVQIAENPLAKGDLVKADAMISATPNLNLLMRYADCVPILLYDPHNRAIGIVHAGWLGTVRKAASAAVRKLRAAYGSNPEDLIAGIGPSVGLDHYPVGDDVVELVRESFTVQADQVLLQQTGRMHFDLWKANQLLLEAEGVCQIEQSGICTACNLDDWYSHRGEPTGTGRFGAVMALSG